MRDGAKRRALHRDIVRDQCMIGDGIDLYRSIKDITHTVKQSSPNSLRKMKEKESEGKSRKTLLNIIKKHLQL